VTTLGVLLMALVLLVFLNRVLDIGLRGNDRPSGAARIDVAGELLVTLDEEAHRHLRVIHLQEADSGLEQATTRVLYDSPWSVPRRNLVGSINRPALAAMATMLRGSELPAGFQFPAPAATTSSTTATP
jgi:hypothetical protein